MHEKKQEPKQPGCPEVIENEGFTKNDPVEWVELELECEQQIEDLSMACQALMANFYFGSAA